MTPGSVLYLALEDGKRRGQQRLLAALAGRTMPRGRLEVQWEARPIGAGLEDDIADWLEGHPDAVLVAVDTLGKVRPPGDGRRNAYEVDVAAMNELQNLFRDRPVGLVIVHHARKESSDDFLASVSGTYGITGSADTIVVVRRKRNEAFGTIHVTGRDVADEEISARFDELAWTAAPGALSAASFERTEVYRVIEEHGPIFPQAIADRLGKGRQNVQNMVNGLVGTGAVARTRRGYVTAAVLIDTAPESLSLPGVSGVSGRHQGHADDARAGHDDGAAPGAIDTTPNGGEPSSLPRVSSVSGRHHGHGGYPRAREARCPACGRVVELDGAGLLRPHYRDADLTDAKWGRGPCPGAGTDPASPALHVVGGDDRHIDCADFRAHPNAHIYSALLGRQSCAICHPEDYA